MTGEKNRYSSVEKLWKLDDETLKTPKHDEMVIWLLNEANVAFLLFQEPNAGLIHADYMVYAMTAENEWLNHIFRPSTNEYESQAVWDKIEEKDFLWDKIKTADRDSWVDIIHEHSQLRWPIPNIPKVFISSEVPILTETRFIVGYWDIYIDWDRSKNRAVYSENKNFERHAYYLPGKIAIEVKPKIISFGATLRQLRTYHAYLTREERNLKIFLFTPDLRFKDAFESQGIQVIDASKAMNARPYVQLDL